MKNPRSEARTRRVEENWECRSGYEIGEQQLQCGVIVGDVGTLESPLKEITVANRRPLSLLPLFLSLLCNGPGCLAGRTEKEKAQPA